MQVHRVRLFRGKRGCLVDNIDAQVVRLPGAFGYLAGQLLCRNVLKNAYCLFRICFRPLVEWVCSAFQSS